MEEVGETEDESQSISSILHVGKIFEVGISESLRDQAAYLGLDIIEKAGSVITAELAFVYELVIGVLDVNRSKEKGYETIVKDGFCAELDELRVIYEELPEFLDAVSALELSTLPRFYEDNTLQPSFIAIYTIWKERNKRIFKGEMASLDKLKKEAVWELDIALSKIKRMKKTQKNMEWAASKGIVPEFFQKKKDKWIREPC